MRPARDSARPAASSLSAVRSTQVDANLAAAGFDASEFDAVVAADKFDAIKPAPDIFLAAAQLMGVPPSACVVVEDAPAGIQAARNAGEAGRRTKPCLQVCV